VRPMEPGTMRRRFAQARIARLATVRASGAPHLVPVCFALDGDRIVTAVDTKPKTTTALQRFDNVRSRPSVSLLVDHWDEDWSQLWWVRVDGSARIVDAGADLDRALTALTAKYRGQYGLRSPTGPAIVVEPQQWRGWTAGL
jgi:PPOX class probable F420-dependent enzyme